MKGQTEFQYVPGGVFDADVFDEGNFFKDVLALIPLVQPAIDNGKCQCITDLKKNHDRHGEQAVYLAGDLTEGRAGIAGAFKADDKKEVGFHGNFRIAGCDHFFGIKQA